MLRAQLGPSDPVLRHPRSTDPLVAREQEVDRVVHDDRDVHGVDRPQLRPLHHGGGQGVDLLNRTQFRPAPEGIVRGVAVLGTSRLSWTRTRGSVARDSG